MRHVSVLSNPVCEFRLTLYILRADDLKRNSLIRLPETFVVPGGRFRESYYWDSYWVARGLLISDMPKTVKGMIENFVYQVRRFGYVPNGAREYYLGRSQQPYLLPMLADYVKYTADFAFVAKNVDALEMEIRFFEEKRSFQWTWKNGRKYTVFRFGADCRGPRPESYKEDAEDAEEHFEDEDERQEFYVHVMAAAESGWDFSSRWFINASGGRVGSKLDIKACFILPVDLNALMYKNYLILTDFMRRLGRDNKAEEYEKKAEGVFKALCELFWDDRENMWFDVDILNKKRRKFFFASNLQPLWAEAYPKEDAEKVAKCSVDYLRRSGALHCHSGIPASIYHTNEQWDFNVWAPLQQIVVEGLVKTGNDEAAAVAKDVAKKFVNSAIVACNEIEKTCSLYEKYGPMKLGKAGEGGEYDVQLGFGWTNGVLLEFIDNYGDGLIKAD